MKLFKVELRGNRSFLGVDDQTSYVVASDPTTAYEIVRSYLERRDMGDDEDRELEKIQLIAEEGNYPNCRTRLMVQKENGREEDD